MNFARVAAICLLALLLVPVAAQATQVSATLDRSQIQLGDTVTLNIRVEGAGGQVVMPDLSALSPDFSVLGTSQNRSVQVDNGKATSSLTFGVALRPDRVGTLQIPALTVAGEQTAPLHIEVSAPSPAAAAASDQALFMEAQVEPQRGYVGEQFSYVVKLFYADDLSGGAINLPTVGGIALEQLGKDLNYESQRGGRNYRVLERRYALVPQQAGQIRIPPANFQGTTVDAYNPNSFFGTSSNVAASAPAVSIDVRPAPTDWGNSAWLPARALSLGLAGWPGPQQEVRVGQPLNLTMTLQATGLSDDALPPLSLPPLEGATAYPDKPVTHNHVDGQWTIGEREQAFAIVPERPGTLTLPATTLKWWNVLTDKMEVAQIPARSVTVLPAIGGSSVQPSIPAGTASVPSASAPHHALAAVSSPMTWRWIALGSLALWVFSMMAWWWHRRRVGPTRMDPPATSMPAAPTTAREAQLAFLVAARASDVAAQVRDLLAWARAERPGIQHLGELSAALDDPAQRSAIDALQRRHYAGVPVSTGDGDIDLVDAFRRGFRWRVSGDESDTSLPPLYPFKLH
ncbi:MAG: BatD family protein [Rhodanobacter sp.]